MLDLLKQTGPLVAPSVNPEGQSPAKNIAEARKYFGDKVDFYQDGGRLGSLSSTVISVSDGVHKVVRFGAGDDILKRL